MQSMDVIHMPIYRLKKHMTIHYKNFIVSDITQNVSKTREKIRLKRSAANM